MITNERQYQATQAAARMFEQALEQADETIQHWGSRLQEAMKSGIASDLAHLREELQEYEDFRAGKIREVTIEHLDELPDILIRARIASGLTQRELAEDMGIKEQQVQRYEASRYKSASLTRLISVARALEIEVRIQATLPNGAEFRPRREQINAEIAAMMQRAMSGDDLTDEERPTRMGEVA